MRIRQGLCTAWLAGVFLVACGKGSDEGFKPVVADVNGKVESLSEAEAQEICATHYCEENQIYSANFGKKKTEPAPDPGTGNPPTNPSEPSQPSESLDYSRSILRAETAWAISEGSSDIIVAVVDTGIDYEHPDLVNNIWANQAEKDGLPGVDDDDNGYVDDVYGWDFYNRRPNGKDDNGHGTHCAGIIGAEKNGIGVRGIAPKVKLMPLKFLGASGSGDTRSAVEAIRYAVKMGAKIISNSWGGGGYSQLLDQAVQDARAAGVLVVAAAGNEETNNDDTPYYPANISGVISVGSSTDRDQISSFSNFGRSTVSVIAPGSSIYSTHLKKGYKSLSGTSMATPQVAGALALALSVKKDLAVTTAESLLCSSSRSILRSYARCGRMDVGAFVEAVSTQGTPTLARIFD